MYENTILKSIEIFKRRSRRRTIKSNRRGE
jgi:hypothetical protein